MITHKISVYGSLRRFFGRNHILYQCRLIGDGWVKNAKMFSLNAFPGAIPVDDESKRIRVETYEVSDAILERLDEIEGVEYGFYTRQKVTVHLDDGEIILSEIYFLANKDEIEKRFIGTLQEVQSGDWLEYLLLT